MGSLWKRAALGVAALGLMLGWSPAAGAYSSSVTPYHIAKLWSIPGGSACAIHAAILEIEGPYRPVHYWVGMAQHFGYTNSGSGCAYPFYAREATFWVQVEAYSWAGWYPLAGCTTSFRDTGVAHWINSGTCEGMAGAGGQPHRMHLYSCWSNQVGPAWQCAEEATWAQTP
jgi:hypothetical protein